MRRCPKALLCMRHMSVALPMQERWYLSSTDVTGLMCARNIGSSTEISLRLAFGVNRHVCCFDRQLLAFITFYQ